MTGSKKAIDALAETSPKGSVELSETALAEAAGGAVFPSAPALGGYKFNGAQKVDTDPALLLPAVKPEG